MGRIKAFNKIDSFGERLKLVRLCFQITQSELADMIDVTQGTLTKIERNVYLPEQDVIEKLSTLFSLHPLYLRYGEAPIFTKKMIFCDFIVSDRNRKLQNLFSGDIIKKIVLYLLNKEQVYAGYKISGKSVKTVFIFASNIKSAHYLFFRTDIEVGAFIEETLKEQTLMTDQIENTNLLEVVTAMYESSSQKDVNLLKDKLKEIGIPKNLNPLLTFSEKEMLSPMIITEIPADKDMVQKLADFFLANKANENDIRAAMKWLKEIRKSEEN
jgi:transcriptional regulator with XRE-family HTH domain